MDSLGYLLKIGSFFVKNNPEQVTALYQIVYRNSVSELNKESTGPLFGVMACEVTDASNL